MVDKLGRKTGGRKAGTRNKATEEAERVRNLIAEQVGQGLTEVRAIVVLAELMVQAKAELARWRRSKAKGARANAAAWFDRTERVASKLAPFQSPTYKAIAVLPTPDVKEIEGEKVQEITLRIFEGGRLALPPKPQLLETETRETGETHEASLTQRRAANGDPRKGTG